jgi:hypothetical protein
MSAERINPFADLSDFETKPAAKPVRPVESEQIEQIAREHGFPSRQPAKTSPPDAVLSRPSRRYRTGRNQQINIKATAETIERLYRLADSEHLPLGELLARALDAFEREQGPEGQGNDPRRPA